MNEVEGDLLDLAGKGRFDVIIHGCNCFCIMGAGIAKNIRHQYPAAYEADQLTAKGDRKKLGTYSTAEVPGLIVVNAYTQYGYGRHGDLVDYTAVRNVFRSIARDFSGRRIGYPKIGAGLAGGDWDTISQIIDEELANEDHALVVLPEPS